MKTITAIDSVTVDSPGAGKATIVVSYSEAVDVGFAAATRSIAELPAANRSWGRSMKLTPALLLIQKSGATSFAFVSQCLSAIAAAFSAALSWVPIIADEDQPVADTCVASSTAAEFEVGTPTDPNEQSETAVAYQWKYQTKSSGVLTSNNINVSNNDTVTAGGKVYTFKDTLSPAEGEVLKGGDADASLLNLIRAINHTGTPDTDYKCAAANTQVRAEPSVTAHAITIRALTSGTDGNAIATTKSAATLSWGAATMTGGGTWSNATSTVLGCAYTNGTTDTLTCTPTTTMQSGTKHKCTLTNAAGSTDTNEVVLTIT